MAKVELGNTPLQVMEDVARFSIGKFFNTGMISRRTRIGIYTVKETIGLATKGCLEAEGGSMYREYCIKANPSSFCRSCRIKSRSCPIFQRYNT
jgi:hypothetical protein